MSDPDQCLILVNVGGERSNDMNTQSKTYWVVPFLDDVAEFLSEHGMPESSNIVAEAAARVQRCSQHEGGLEHQDRAGEDDCATGNVVRLGFLPRKH
jgi:hypothetical protein